MFRHARRGGSACPLLCAVCARIPPVSPRASPRAAQHNRLEFFPMFLASEWIAAFYFCPFASSAAGAVYLYGSKRYVDGYVESAKGRHEGFAIATRALYALLGMGIAGIGHAVLKEGFGFDILEVAHVRPIMDKIGL